MQWMSSKIYTFPFCVNISQAYRGSLTVILQKSQLSFPGTIALGSALHAVSNNEKLHKKNIILQILFILFFAFLLFRKLERLATIFQRQQISIHLFRELNKHQNS